MTKQDPIPPQEAKIDVDRTDQASSGTSYDPAHMTAQAFLEQLKEFGEKLTQGARMAVCLSPTGDKKLFVNHVTVRVPEVICISGVDEDGLAFSHICHYSQLNAQLMAYRVS